MLLEVHPTISKHFGVDSRVGRFALPRSIRQRRSHLICMLSWGLQLLRERPRSWDIIYTYIYMNRYGSRCRVAWNMSMYLASFRRMCLSTTNRCSVSRNYIVMLAEHAWRQCLAWSASEHLEYRDPLRLLNQVAGCVEFVYLVFASWVVPRVGELVLEM